jgi:MFS family permease
VESRITARRETLLRNSDFMKLWAGQAVSAFGSRITRDGLPYAALLTLSATSVQMGFMTLAGALPVLLIGLFAGVWVDRVRRRPILIAADLGRALVLASVPIAAITGTLTMWHLYIVAAVHGVLTLFFDVADRSYLPTVVRRDQIVEANSRLSATGSLAEVGGPALSGALVQLITAPVAIALDAVSFLWSALCIGLIRTPEARHIPEAQRNSVWRDIGEGLQLVWRTPILRALALGATTRDFFGWFYAALYGLYAIRELGLSAATVGLTISMGGVGALIGAATAGRAARRFGIGPTLVAASVIVGVIELLVPLAFGPFALVLSMLLFAQLAGDVLWEVYFINEMSLRQMIVPSRLLGRANAIMHFLVGGAGPIGAVVAGFLAQAITARYTLLIAALGMIASSLWLIFSPLPRLITVDRPEGGAEAQEVEAHEHTPT